MSLIRKVLEMKGLRFIILLCSIAISVESLSQSRTYLGAEVAGTHDLYSFIDEGNRLNSDLILSGYYGITLAQSIGKSFTIESGFIRKHYEVGYDFDLNSPLEKAGGSSNAFNSFQIPFRLKAYYPIFRNRISIFTTVGYHLSIRSGSENLGTGEGGIYTESDTIVTFHTSRSGLAKTFSLL